MAARTPHALVLRHASCEGVGAIGDALHGRGIDLREVCLHEGASTPDTLGGAAALVVMGGPMSVYEPERYPHLTREVHLIERALREGVPVLGVCLGSQLLAAALGARVYASGTKEIGWYDVQLGPGCVDDALFRGVTSPLRALCWHGDVFDLPRDAVPLARTELTLHQAFRWGTSAWGVLFHLEASAAQARAMTAAFPDELAAARVDPEALAADSDAHAPAALVAGLRVFGRFADRITASRR